MAQSTNRFKHGILFIFLLITAASLQAAELYRKQTGTATIAAASTNTTVTIPAVDRSKSFLVFSTSLDSQNPTDFQIGGQITNSTTLTFIRTGNTGAVTIKWQVFEFEGGVNVQHGSTTGVTRGAAMNVPINCVDLTKSFVLISARKSGAQLGADDGITANLTTSTNLALQVSANGPGGADMEEAYWQVIEYQAATVKKVTATLAATVASATSTISPAVSNLAKAMVISNHGQDGDVNPDDLPRTELTNTTTVTYTRVGTTAAINFVTYVIEFTDATTVTRGTQNFASTSTTQNVSITATANSGIFGSGNYGRQGSSSFAVNDNTGHGWFTYDITSTTNLLIQRATGTAGGNSSADVPWQIVTFENTNLQQSTFYSRATGDWEANTTWSFSSNGSSGAVPIGVYPRRSDNVVIQSGHIVTINSTSDNGPCPQSPDGLGRSNIGAGGGAGFNGSNLSMFYHTGDITIVGRLNVTSGVNMMVEGYTHITSTGIFDLSSYLVNVGYLLADASSTLTTLDDLSLTGNSTTIINTNVTSADDLNIDFTNATLCGTGTAGLLNSAGSAINYTNGGTVNQICTTFTVTCSGGGCAGFPVVGTTTILAGNVGPGGVGNSTNNRLWLMANQQVYVNAGTTDATDNQLVQQWNDLSGNARNATELTNKPTLRTNIVNGFPAIRYDNTDRLLSTGLATANSASVYVVAQYSSLPTSNPGLVQGSPASLGFDTGGTNKVLGMWVNNTGTSWGRVVQTDNTQINIPQVTSLSTSTFFALSNIVSATSLTVRQFVNNVVSGSIAYNGTLRSWTDFGIGRQGSETWNGDIAEVIVYSTDLNAAQRMLASNYLSAKYTTTLSVANDVYTMDNAGNGNYDFEVAGIGQASDGSNHKDAKGTGIVRMWNPNGLANSEFLMWGHDNTAITSTTTAVGTAVDGTIIKERLSRIWRAGETGDVGATSISFDFGGVGGSPLGSNLRLLVDRDSDGFADNDVAPAVGSTIGSEVVFSNVNLQNGDRFTLGNTDNSIPLPIELISFDASVIKAEVKLAWSTASELNNEFFTVQRSQDAEQWQDVIKVKGAITSDERIDYETTDGLPFTGVSYYRLKQTDLDGQYSYSSVRRVEMSELFQLKVYPNPSTGKFAISTGFELQPENIKFYNSIGQEMPIALDKSSGSTILDTSIPRGIYILHVVRGYWRQSVRVIIE